VGRRRFVRIVLGLILASWAIQAPTHAETADEGYLDRLMENADVLELADSRAWLALGHYRPDLLGSGHHSLIDSPDFFLARDGKTDPQAELKATLEAFFAPLPIDAAGQHPQCAFVARYRWLKSQLAFDPKRLPEHDCEAFETWAATINADAATLIFPAAYMNNPASMFGHTLLRLDPAEQSEDSRLLSFAVNYGADTGDHNGLLFAVLGLTGGYRGTYAVKPYYELVKIYSDIENRDIYEYRLNFTETEIARLVAHLWEMRGHYSYYYFFDENCSYQLLFLLDVARPSLGLAGDFDLHVIPIDSVRAVLDRRDLFESAKFRPSGQTRIRQDLAKLTKDGRRLAQRLAAGSLNPGSPDANGFPPARRAAVLELAESVVTYRMETGDLSRDEAADRAWTLLAARSRIEETSDLPPVDQPETRPDQGHGSARAGISTGFRDGRPFGAMRLRPAYHDDLDPSGGFVPGAAIDFLSLELRHYDGDDGVTLDRFTGVGIRSMTPRDDLFHPLSWKLNAGLERMRIERTDEEGALVAALDGGVGLSYGLGERDIWSMTLDAGVTAGEDCDETCSFNAGPSLSLLWPVNDHVSFMAKGGYQLRFGEEIRDRYEVRLGQSFGFTRNLALKLEAGVEEEGGGLQPEFLTSLDWYF
jgi:hypothetical protein